ncbi:Hypothetical predicted protein [Cloeon dipterum]|uniref:Uncharacterized protein n=1 Tax=Cloeon dipterum TaxID=197152 RepID=A0A8S1DNK9_9INSE|nr:Hypothetical predicted protein [Cloeon dipterum]
MSQEVLPEMESNICPRGCGNQMEKIGNEFVCLQCISGRRIQQSWILNYILYGVENIEMCPKRCGNQLVRIDNYSLCMKCNAGKKLQRALGLNEIPSKRVLTGLTPPAACEQAPWSNGGLSTIAIDPVNSRCTFCSKFIAVGDREAHSIDTSCLQCGTFFGCIVNKAKHYQYDCWI